MERAGIGMDSHIEVYRDFRSYGKAGCLAEVIDHLARGRSARLDDVYVPERIVGSVVVDVYYPAWLLKAVEILSEPLLLSAVNGKGGVKPAFFVKVMYDGIGARKEKKELGHRVFKVGDRLFPGVPQGQREPE